MLDEIKYIAKNRKALFDFAVEETFECGIVLVGTEVKSMKAGEFSFTDSFAEVVNGEVWLKNFHISPYEFSSVFNHAPDRPKKLLLNRTEIKRIERRVFEKGNTLIPIDFYLKKGRVKMTLALCKGKKLYDKRADIKERDVKRDLQREFRKRLQN